MGFAAQRIDHVEVFVGDLEAAAGWYAKVLGLRTAHRFEPDPWMIGAGGTQLALFQRPEGEAPRRVRQGWRRVAWLTDAAGFERAQAHLRACAVPFKGPVDHDVAHSIYFEDLDGNPLEITYYLSPG